MGNCLDRRSPDQSDAGVGSPGHGAKKRETEEKSKNNAPTEVKIRVTKKQLEELLRRVEQARAGGAPVREAIAEVLDMDGADDHVGRGGPHWRPSLQSIPE